MMHAAVDMRLVDVEGGEQHSRQTSDSPVKALLRDVLADAFTVRDLARKGNSLCYAQVQQDRTWICSDEDSPFSFVWICQHLGLEPRKLRSLYFSAAPVSIPRGWAA